MRFLKTVVLIALITILLTGCIFETYYSREYGHLSKYVLRDGQITIDKNTYMLCNWNYPKYPSSNAGDEVFSRIDDQDQEMRYNGILYELHQFSDRSFLIYVYEADAGSGWGGCRVLRRSDIDMPELTYENVDSLESENFAWKSQDEAFIYELFGAMSDEANNIENDDIIRESEYYDTITYRNDDWPDFCFQITIRYVKDEYFVWSVFLGEGSAWITMPHNLIEKIKVKSE